MEKLFTAVCTIAVEGIENEKVTSDQLADTLENCVRLNMDYENSETQVGEKGNVVGITLDWETLTPARKPAIQVWSYDDAPDELKYRSPHGGDNDWVALVPKELVPQNPENLWIPWLEQGHFGNFVSRETLEDGSVLFISAHA